jgi:hypothetical protein
MEKVLNTTQDGSGPEGRIMHDQVNRRTGLLAAPMDVDGENRSKRRRRTLKLARVVLSDSTVIDCKLRDLSEEGAHLVFGGAISLPDEFRLYNVSDAVIAPVRLEWQRGLEAGVRFTGPQDTHALL